MTVLPVGTKLLDGTFTVGKVVGQGGFGITYHGSDTQLNRHVAVKEFFPVGSTRVGNLVQPHTCLHAAGYLAAKEKFLNEARTLASFRHEGIVPVYTCFEENNTAYLVMEFLKGKTLTQAVQTRGVLPEKEAAEIIVKVAVATLELHANNVLHRDIKPDNIVICDDGRVVLIDFGLTKKMEEVTGATTRQLSKTAALGSEGYAPPEQYLKTGNIGPHTDVYALGATLYFALTGEVPPSAMERLAGQPLCTPIQYNPQLGSAVNEAVLHAMSLKVEERTATAEAFIVKLRSSTPNTSVTVPSPGASTAPSPFSQLYYGVAADTVVGSRKIGKNALCPSCGQLNYFSNHVAAGDQIECWACHQQFTFSSATVAVVPAAPAAVATQAAKPFSKHFGRVGLGLEGYASEAVDIGLHVNVEPDGLGRVFLSVTPHDARRSTETTMVKQHQLAELKRLIEEAERTMDGMMRTGQIKKTNF